MENTMVDDMFTNSQDAVSTLTNRSNYLAEQGSTFGNHSIVACSIPSSLCQRQATSTVQQPIISTGTVPGSVPAMSESSQMVYHRMTSPQLMSWPISQTMDPATIRRLMTPLHVVTSFRNDNFPLYPQDASTTEGGGLLKIATEVHPYRPPTEVQQYTSMYSSSQGPGYQDSMMTGHRPSSCPTLAVAPITNGEIGGIKRPASEEPAPNVNWPQLKRRKGRTTFTKEQVDMMEAHFQTSMYLTVRERRELAQQLALEDTQVKTWFQNRRMRWKRQHPEKQLTPAKPPTSRRSRTQVVRPMQCPPTASQPDQFVVPTPPPSVSTPSAVASNTRQSSELPMTYPMLPPSPIYNHRMVAPSLQDNCYPAQAVYGVPVFPHHLPTGFGMHPWMSTNAVGPHGGAQYPPRHV
ncbi:homeobox protein vent1-like [Patiria miniata]|uniref:Homeobox domain-containing protein n=1 Tax=Patiria miniata TaxID=46514 RepID=A0A914B510_PATMI|nr:homeobox protein vent1-like [Patiria miniata]